MVKVHVISFAHEEVAVTEGDDGQGVGMGSAPVRGECLQGKAVTAWAGLSLPLVQLGNISCCGMEQVRWWLHFWVGLGLTSRAMAGGEGT